MTGEGAAELCMSLAEEVRTVRWAGCGPTRSMSDTVAALLTAPATTILDALALSAMSRKLLSHTVEQFGDDMTTMDDDQVAAAFALMLLCRAVAILETKTGYSAEGFTGEADAIN